MGKKKAHGEGSGLGRALIKERLNAGRGYRRNDTWVRKCHCLIIKLLFRYSISLDHCKVLLIWNIYKIIGETMTHYFVIFD